jgi:hypothetical protein
LKEENVSKKKNSPTAIRELNLNEIKFVSGASGVQHQDFHIVKLVDRASAKVG